MKSVGQKIKQLNGLLGTSDLTEWETTFVEDIALKTDVGAQTTQLSPKQVEKIDSIYNKHFA